MTAEEKMFFAFFIILILLILGIVIVLSIKSRLTPFKKIKRNELDKYYQSWKQKEKNNNKNRGSKIEHY